MPPPWWPEGEPWPPRRPPWQLAPQRFRRRFLVAVAVLLALLLGLGVLVGLGVRRAGEGPPRYRDRGRAGPGVLLGLAAVVALVGGLATVRAYRRIGGPVGDLLAASERLASGDYTARVHPDGPRELRSLAATFNTMAGRLAAADEQRRRFLADVTHELRTPLAVLQGGVEAQLDGIHPRDDHHLTSLLEETQLLARLVEDLHTLALADAGRLSLHRERTHPSALVDDAVESLGPLAARAGVTVTSSVAPDLPGLDVDPTRIRQVLANLLANALRHAPEGSDVQLTVAPDGAAVRFTVIDAGPGFRRDQLETVFERFTRAVDSRGSGLGLSIARDLVQAHGGTIAVGNREGGGAYATFTVPVTG